MTCGIYKITNLLNNKNYIGLSSNIEKRWKEHLSDTYSCEDKHFNNPLYKDIKEIGIQNFSFTILEECDQDSLSEKEKYYIKIYNTYIPNGYNRTLGGRGKIKPSSFICEKCGKQLKKFVQSKTH